MIFLIVTKKLLFCHYNFHWLHFKTKCKIFQLSGLIKSCKHNMRKRCYITNELEIAKSPYDRMRKSQSCVESWSNTPPLQTLKVY